MLEDMGNDWIPKKGKKGSKDWFFNDADMDGVMNGIDCEPYNKNKQDKPYLKVRPVSKYFKPNTQRRPPVQPTSTYTPKKEFKTVTQSVPLGSNVVRQPTSRVVTQPRTFIKGVQPSQYLKTTPISSPKKLVITQRTPVRSIQRKPANLPGRKLNITSNKIKFTPKATISDHVRTGNVYTEVGQNYAKEKKIIKKNIINNNYLNINPQGYYKNPKNIKQTISEIKSKTYASPKAQATATQATYKYAKDNNYPINFDKRTSGPFASAGGLKQGIQVRGDMAKKDSLDANISLIHETSHMQDSINKNYDEINSIKYNKDTQNFLEKTYTGGNPYENKAYYIHNYYTPNNPNKRLFYRNDIINNYEKQLNINTEKQYDANSLMDYVILSKYKSNKYVK